MGLSKPCGKRKRWKSTAMDTEMKVVILFLLNFRGENSQMRN